MRTTAMVLLIAISGCSNGTNGITDGSTPDLSTISDMPPADLSARPDLTAPPDLSKLQI